jgi:hypothetical protein
MLYGLGRLMQLVGLILLPVAMAGNLAEQMSLKDMYIVCGVGLVLFLIGLSLQKMTPRR